MKKHSMHLAIYHEYNSEDRKHDLLVIDLQEQVVNYYIMGGIHIL